MGWNNLIDNIDRNNSMDEVFRMKSEIRATLIKLVDHMASQADINRHTMFTYDMGGTFVEVAYHKALAAGEFYTMCINGRVYSSLTKEGVIDKLQTEVLE